MFQVLYTNRQILKDMGIFVISEVHPWLLIGSSPSNFFFSAQVCLLIFLMQKLEKYFLIIDH